MLRIFKTFDGQLKQIPDAVRDCWISLINPNEAELENICGLTNVDMADLRAAMDYEERSRIQFEDNYTMILVNIPTVEVRHEKTAYDTIPMSIIIVNDMIITVCMEDNPVLKAFEESKIKNFHTHMKTRFILQLLHRNASLYLQYLREIDKKSDAIERQLHDSTRNQELIELLELEKSLVYFTTSLRSNEIVLEKLTRTSRIKKYPEDTDLLDDVIIENKQAIEMANIYSGILNGMMGAFASVISNNQNTVMKFLATITIVMSIPTMIFSAYGMNVNSHGMPFADNFWGFFIVIALSLCLTLTVALLFAKKNYFH